MRFETTEHKHGLGSIADLSAPFPDANNLAFGKNLHDSDLTNPPKSILQNDPLTLTKPQGI